MLASLLVKLIKKTFECNPALPYSFDNQFVGKPNSQVKMIREVKWHN